MQSFCITFLVFVVMSDIYSICAANGLCEDTPSNVGGVHGIWSHISIFVLLVEDHVTVYLEEKKILPLVDVLAEAVILL